MKEKREGVMLHRPGQRAIVLADMKPIHSDPQSTAYDLRSGQRRCPCCDPRKVAGLKPKPAPQKIAAGGADVA